MIICEASTANIQNCERLKAFSLRQGCQFFFLPLPLNILLEVLVREIRQEKEIKTYSSCKGRSETLYSQMTWSYIQKIIKNTQERTRINKLGKSADLKST